MMWIEGRGWGCITAINAVHVQFFISGQLRKIAQQCSLERGAIPKFAIAKFGCKTYIDSSSIRLVYQRLGLGLVPAPT